MNYGQSPPPQHHGPAPVAGPPGGHVPPHPPVPPTQHPQKPKVLRWLVLWLLFGVLSLGYSFWVAAGSVASLVTEDQSINPTLSVELKQGQPFGLVKPSSAGPSIPCTVTPQAGQPREFRASSSSSRRSRSATFTAEAWFTGPAEIRCTSTAYYAGPEKFSRNALTGSGALAGISGLCLVIALVQVYRRTRPQVRAARDQSRNQAG